MTMPMNTPANRENFNESFVFYASFAAAISKIPDRELRLQAYEMLFDYALLGVEPQLGDGDWAVDAIFSAIKPQIDANNKRRANGKKGGRKPAQETAVQEPEAPEAASQGASTAPTNATPEANATAPELDMAALVSQVTGQVLKAVQAATPTASAAQAQPAVQIEPIMQAQPVQPAVQAQPVQPTAQAQAAVQAEPMVQAESTVQPTPTVQPEPAAQAQTAVQAEPAVHIEPTVQSEQLERIVHFGENRYPTTPTELRQFEQFAYKLFETYHGAKPNLADLERVLERSYTRMERADGAAIAVFDRDKADLLAYAFEQAKKADKLNWRYLDGMYRNFAARNIVTGAEAVQYEMQRTNRFQ